jgi:hypothetical protein
MQSDDSPQRSDCKPQLNKTSEQALLCECSNSTTVETAYCNGAGDSEWGGPGVNSCRLSKVPRDTKRTRKNPQKPSGR